MDHPEWGEPQKPHLLSPKPLKTVKGSKHYALRVYALWFTPLCSLFKKKKNVWPGVKKKKKKARRNKSEECLAPNICILHGLWNEDTWWSDSREEGLQGGTGGQFSSLLVPTRREPLWRRCCCSGLFLCASGRPVSFHLLQILAAREREW